jgi:3-phenylpropionate/cinnamic acid dioxygenase small subunit
MRAATDLPPRVPGRPAYWAAHSRGDPVQDLQELEAIRQLKYRYFRALDTKHWDELTACLAEDCRWSECDGSGRLYDREEVMDSLKRRFERSNILTMHQAHHPELELTEETKARGIWAIQDRAIDLQFNITTWGAAYHTDEYVKIDGEWRIQSISYERLFEEMESRADKPDLKLTLSKFDGAPSL